MSRSSEARSESSYIISDDRFNDLNTSYRKHNLSNQDRAKTQYLMTRFPSKPKAATVPIVRKKAFAHKTRTGCDACKRRHLKCGEERPICNRCKKGCFSCRYNAPEPWVFQTGFQGSRDRDSTDAKSIYRLNDSLGLAWGSLEERRALQHWRESTGPYLANYSSNRDRRTWELIFPRLTMSLPATRHLLVAVSMIDEMVHDASREDLTVRSRRILHHYNHAIRHLTLHNPSMLEIISASLLAWVLEVCLWDITRAMMHLEASSRLFEKFIANGGQHDDSESSDIILNQLSHTRDSCEGYTSTHFHSARPRFRDETCVLTVLMARNSPQDMRSAEEARTAMGQYFTTFENSQDMAMSPSEAREYFKSWEIALLKYRHVSKESYVEVVALHLLTNLALALLPRDEVSASVSTTEVAAEGSTHLAGLNPGCGYLTLLHKHDVASQHRAMIDAAMEYSLNQIEEFMALEDLDAENRRGLEQTVVLILEKVVRYATQRAHQERASRLMKTLSLI